MSYGKRHYEMAMRLSLVHREPKLPKTPVPHRTFEELLSDQLDPLYRTAVAGHPHQLLGELVCALPDRNAGSRLAPA